MLSSQNFWVGVVVGVVGCHIYNRYSTGKAKKA